MCILSRRRFSKSFRESISSCSSSSTFQEVAVMFMLPALPSTLTHSFAFALPDHNNILHFFFPRAFHHFLFLLHFFMSDSHSTLQISCLFLFLILGASIIHCFLPVSFQSCLLFTSSPPSHSPRSNHEINFLSISLFHLISLHPRLSSLNLLH